MKSAWICALAIWSGVVSAEPTRASDSAYEQDIFAAHTSRNLSKADLAWHAMNTYGWDCDEVVAEKKAASKDYTVINCSSGLSLRVYRRADAHPIIRNMKGGYD